MRNRNSLIRERREAFRDARLIVIASEGKDTERIYFKALAKEYTNPRVHVHILKRSEDEKNNSSPEHVLEQLNEYKCQYELEADDELWLVTDKDHWTEAMLSRVATECMQDVSMHMALSNPCFELWLLLHLVDVSSLTPEEQLLWMENRRKSKSSNPYLKVLLRQKMGSYHESAYDVLTLIQHVEVAIERARLLDKNPADRWPQTLGTRVYLLAESVMNRI
ncbi:RloB family protein [uncultured Prevotella sp.]|uniref:RloB family protein n=1 Tax=uncultured Prevotella sp. TaxID=159272 RepID=UPI0025EAA773|nr:RloB family protein [uncultured Prevotella sp.]